MGYLWQKSSASVWGVIKLLKLAIVSKKDIYKKPRTQQQQAISFLKILSKGLQNYLQLVKEKQFEMIEN